MARATNFTKWLNVSQGSRVGQVGVGIGILKYFEPDTTLCKNLLFIFQSRLLTLRIVLQVTVVDFPIYEVLYKLLILEPKCVDDMPKLKAFIDRFEVCEVENMSSTSAFILRFPEYFCCH